MILQRFVCGPISTNCYLFGDDKEVVLIDAEKGVWGELFDRERWTKAGVEGKKQALGKESPVLRTKRTGLSAAKTQGVVLGNSPAIIKTIIATHGHHDHVRGVRKVQENTGVEFWIHRDAENTLKGSLKNAEIGIDRYIEDGDIIEVGEFSLQVIHTPGHSPDGICLYMNEIIEFDNSAFLQAWVGNNPGLFPAELFPLQDILFSGDLLFKGGVGRTDLAGGDRRQLQESLKKLEALPYSTLVLPGHGPPTVLGKELKKLL